MLLLLIVIPCTLAGIAAVTLLDRAGVLPRLDQPPGPWSSKPASSLTRPLALGMIVLLGTWILAWFVVLFVGLNIILSSS